jgi:hypothetical protein
MGRRIAIADASIVTLCHNLAIPDHYRPNWNLTISGALVRLFNGQFHQRPVGYYIHVVGTQCA